MTLDALKKKVKENKDFMSKVEALWQEDFGTTDVDEVEAKLNEYELDINKEEASIAEALVDLSEEVKKLHEDLL